MSLEDDIRLINDRDALMRLAYSLNPEDRQRYEALHQLDLKLQRERSILEFLISACVVEFELSDDRAVMCMTEAVENSSYCDLNKAEFGRFIAELQALHATMVDKE